MAGINPGVGASSASSGGSVNDGVDSSIKATVFDYPTSNPLAVVLRDTNGDYVAVGGGTQYNDGAARGTATGTLGMVDDGTLIQSMKGDSSGRPAVNIEQMGGVNVSMGSGVVGTGVQRVVLATDVALPVGANVIGKVSVDQTTPGTTNAVSIAQLGANTVSTGNGASGTGVLRVAQVNDGTGVIATVSTVTSLTQMNGQAIAMGTGVRSAGTQRVTIATDDVVPASQSGTWSTIPIGSASGTGLSTVKTDAQTATVTSIKGTAGRVYGYHIFNSNTADAFLQFYDIASGGVTVGTSARARTLWIPSGGAIDTTFTIPLTFATAISIAATTTITGSAAPSTGLLVDIDYI